MMRNMRLLSGLIMGLTAAVVGWCPGVNPAFSASPPLKPVAKVDIDKYAGKWYEIALIPYVFERKCAKNAKVEYTRLPDGSLRDYFECELDNGKKTTQKTIMIGRAKVVDTASNAKWSATFLNLLGWRYWFGANYWIIGLGENYEYTVVGNPSRKYGWLMARTPALSLKKLRAVESLLNAQGYDACRFQMVPQTGGATQKTPLCAVTDSHAPQED